MAICWWRLLLAAGLLAVSCAKSPEPPEPLAWETGFWFWFGGTVDSGAEVPPVDALFFQSGSPEYERMPGDLPRAKVYWPVLREERSGVPFLKTAAQTAEVFERIRAEARERKMPVGGLQLDVDCPTRRLRDYAAYLAALRKELPAGTRISITALLDWFRSGTDIDAVIEQVDEFVPQFYDLADPRQPLGEAAIAERIDAKKWRPVFSQFRKPFRIGVSVFGRTRFLKKEEQGRNHAYGLVGDLTPLQMAVRPTFDLNASRSGAGELILTYRARERTRVEFNTFEQGDAAQFISPTPESLTQAVSQARQMGGYCTGVLFFRWPARGEVLTVRPHEALRIAGVPGMPGEVADIRAYEGSCAAVHCWDLYLVVSKPFSKEVSRYRIDSSVELEYFIPEDEMPARMSGASQVEVVFPAYTARGWMSLGRAVTEKPAKFRVEVAP